MTAKAIRTRRKELEREIRAAKMEFEKKVAPLKVELEHLERVCTHPRGYTYGDYGGGTNFCCPTCGLDS